MQERENQIWHDQALSSEIARPVSLMHSNEVEQRLFSTTLLSIGDVSVNSEAQKARSQILSWTILIDFNPYSGAELRPWTF